MKVSFSNYRFFDESMEFDFAPITILTGTNSSGKSSLTYGLRLFKDGFKNGKITLSKEELMKIGSAKNLFKKGKEYDESEIAYFSNSSLLKGKFPEFRLETIFNYLNDNELKLNHYNILMERDNNRTEYLKKSYKSINYSYCLINQLSKYELINALYLEIKSFENEINQLAEKCIKSLFENNELEFIDNEEQNFNHLIIEKLNLNKQWVNELMKLCDNYIQKANKILGIKYLKNKNEFLNFFEEIIINLPDFIVESDVVINEFVVIDFEDRKSVSLSFNDLFNLDYTIYGGLPFLIDKDDYTFLHIYESPFIPWEKIFRNYEKYQIDELRTILEREYLSGYLHLKEGHKELILLLLIYEKYLKFRYESLTLNNPEMLNNLEISNLLYTYLYIRGKVLFENLNIIDPPFLFGMISEFKNTITENNNNFNVIDSHIQFGLFLSNGFKQIENQFIHNIHYHPNLNVHLDKRYVELLDSKNFLSEILEKYYNNKNIKSDAFIKKWIKELNVGDDFHIDKDEQIVKLFIYRDGQEFLLNDEGMGIGKLFPIILHIATLGLEKSKGYLIIEEPESNLHPKLQSKLADLFLDAYKEFSLKFIIETHSEYMIRKLQYIVAKDKGAHYLNEDINIYYFYHPSEIPEGEKQVFEIKITKDGRLTKNFGKGFLDEASDLSMLLFQTSIN